MFRYAFKRISIWGMRSRKDSLCDLAVAGLGEQLPTRPTVLGIDLAKDVFQLHGINENGKYTWQKG